MSAVTLKNVSGAGFPAALNLTVPDREFAVLTGPAKSGISAIVRLIAGLENAKQGDIFFDERRGNGVAPSERDLAFVSSDYVPYPRLSVFENLAIGLRRRKFAETEIRKRVSGVAEALGLQEALQALPATLSSDQTRLVALARAMVRQPKVYLFNQPFAGLAPAAVIRGRAEVVKLHQRASATIILATHDPEEALAFGQRTIVIDSGAVQQDGRARDIFDEPANLIVARFFGEPPMNLVDGTLKLERDVFLFSEAGDGTIAVRLPTLAGGRELVGKSVVLGFRPQDVEVAVAPEGTSRSPAVFRGLVERVEPRGVETDLYLRTGAHDLVCRSRRWTEQGDGGRRFQFEIAEGKTHLFDAETGTRVTPGG
jgi:multiple sugar transport system ATP-binding protein